MASGGPSGLGGFADSLADGGPFASGGPFGLGGFADSFADSFADDGGFGGGASAATAGAVFGDSGFGRALAGTAFCRSGAVFGASAADAAFVDSAFGGGAGAATAVAFDAGNNVSIGANGRTTKARGDSMGGRVCARDFKFTLLVPDEPPGG